MATKSSVNRLLKALGALAVACFARSMDGRLSAPLQNSYRAIATRLRGIIKALVQRDLGGVPTADVEAVTSAATAAAAKVSAVANENQGNAALALARAVASNASKLGA